MVSWVHVKCYKVPKKKITEYGSIEGWLDAECPIVADGDEAAMRDQVIEMLMTTKNAPKTPPKSPAKLEKIKRRAEERGDAAEEELLEGGGSR
jgi:hypothetical protein